MVVEVSSGHAVGEAHSTVTCPIGGSEKKIKKQMNIKYSQPMKQKQHTMGRGMEPMETESVLCTSSMYCPDIVWSPEMEFS